VCSSDLRRGGRDGDRRGGRGGRDGGGGGASFRVINELGSVEKAITKADFVAMKAPLTEALKALKPLRLSSLDKLDMNARGKLITSLMRVVRLPKPKADPVADAPAADAAPVEPAAEAAAPAEGAAPAEAAAAPAAPVAAPAVDPKVGAWHDVQFTIGLIWTSVGEKDRAATAFENAGRQPTEADLAVPAAAPAREARPERGPRGERGDRPPRGDRKDRPERGPRAERSDRPERSARPERRPRPQVTHIEPFHSSGDWKTDAQKLEEMGRTRDAARLHEKNQSFADAVRLFEGGGDVKSALRAAAAGKMDISGYVAKLKQEEVIEALERAQAWETLMELHQKRGDFESIAKLYERAAQFDQAALAWERAGKYAPARKAYERAKDYAAANRVRDLEIAKLIERGDRLGAATVLMTVGKKAEALESVCAPMRIAATAFSMDEKAVMRMTVISSLRSRISFKSSMPFVSGSLKSSSTRSMKPESRTARASAPDIASATR
jgi:tetratricopeptide (TPR) repeat protein